VGEPIGGRGTARWAPRRPGRNGGVNPQLINREVYVVPAVVGASALALLLRFDALNSLTMTLAAALAFVLRLLALRFGWRAPRAWHRRSTAVEVEE
jgi:uncharacterized membrane protein YeiH